MVVRSFVSIMLMIGFSSPSFGESFTFSESFDSAASMAHFSVYNRGGCSNPGNVQGGRLVVSCQNNSGSYITIAGLSAQPNWHIHAEVTITVSRWNDNSGPFAVGYYFGRGGFPGMGDYYLAHSTYPTSGSFARIMKRANVPNYYDAVTGGPAFSLPGSSYTHRWIIDISPSSLGLRIMSGGTTVAELVRSDSDSGFRSGGQLSLVCDEADCTFDDLVVRAGLPDTDSGVRVRTPQGTIPLAAEPAGQLTSPLRVYNGRETVGLELVDVTHPEASPIRIQTSNGVQAIRHYNPGF